jgi:hypothetical protein
LDSSLLALPNSAIAPWPYVVSAGLLWLFARKLPAATTWDKLWRLLVAAVFFIAATIAVERLWDARPTSRWTLAVQPLASHTEPRLASRFVPSSGDQSWRQIFTAEMPRMIAKAGQEHGAGHD